MEFDRTIGGTASDYGETALAQKLAYQPSLQQRLDLAVKQAEERLAAVEERLAAVKEAREIFQRNPDLEKLLNVMQRGLF